VAEIRRVVGGFLVAIGLIDQPVPLPDLERHGQFAPRRPRTCARRRRWSDGSLINSRSIARPH
jgi:hypothetical protein